MVPAPPTELLLPPFGEHIGPPDREIPVILEDDGILRNGVPDRNNTVFFRSFRTLEAISLEAGGFNAANKRHGIFIPVPFGKLPRFHLRLQREVA